MAEIHIVRLFCRIDKIFCRYDNFLFRLQNFLPNPQVGFGWSRLDFANRYDPFDRQSCFGPASRDYWGITRIGIKFTYFIK